MVTPVVGPTVITQFSLPFATQSRSKYKQAMPVDRPLPYRYAYAYGREDSTSFPPQSSASVKNPDFSFSGMSVYGRLRQSAYNLAYERMRNKLGDSAGWAENIAQIDKTRQTLVNRSVQLASFVSALRRADFSRAARVLRTPIPSKVSNRKAVSQNFLEWEYGVKPVISDIQNSAKQITSHPGDITFISGSASETYREVQLEKASSATTVLRYNTTINGSLTITCRAGVRITNPNLFLANQLGLIDLALPWKLIPFSFVVDWFVNVEQVISSVTDWYGVTLLYPHYTEFSKGSLRKDGFSSGWDATTGTIISHTTKNFDKDSVNLDRVMGLPGPALVVKPFKGFSLERGAQALALVASVLGK